MERNKSNWSSLPEDILAIIAKHLLLHSLDDILRFRAVCHSFRSSSSLVLPPKLPIPRSSFMLFFSSDATPGDGRYFLLTETTIYAIEPLDIISSTHKTTPTWFVKIEKLDSNNVRVKDMFSGFPYRFLSDLFPITLNLLPKPLNLLDYRVKEITKAYRLELATVPRGKVKSRVHIHEMYKMVPSYFRKVVVSECLDSFAIMAIHHKTGKLFVWRNGDKRWINIHPVLDFEDVVYHNNKFYSLAMRHGGLTIAVDSKSLSVKKVADPLENLVNSCHQHLVKSSMDLFLVVVHTFLNCVPVSIYKLDGEEHKWLPVMNGLEDRVFFVG